MTTFMGNQPFMAYGPFLPAGKSQGNRIPCIQSNLAPIGKGSLASRILIIKDCECYKGLLPQRLCQAPERRPIGFGNK